MSAVYRAVASLTFAFSANALIWTYTHWRSGYWRDDPAVAPTWFLLCVILTAFSCRGTFRTNRTQPSVSPLLLASLAIATLTGHVHINLAQSRGAKFKRHAGFENLAIGAILIVLPAAASWWKYEGWIRRNVAVIGAMQMAWGLMLVLIDGARSRRQRAAGEVGPSNSAAD
jgi:hypothetical protein